ncbi:ABC transporter substrate-binding protein [Microvirga massiliensis]|uniref:ABC transporter substrate-binding protein n=1 Tax=Microvirga massiliensis TaxID=1033741 RepID=UPI00062B6B54|nr:ABC transporter substrate-binding protein [Microvirga massiliensis]
MRRLLAALAAAALIAPAALAQGAPSGKLVLYTSQPNTDAQQTIDAFKVKYPDIEISFVRDGTPRILAKLRAEIQAGQPQADVLLIADSVTMESLRGEGLLLAHDEADISAYPAGLHDPQKHWFATKLITTGIVYNTKAPMKPSSWADLAKPEAKGQVTMPSPLTSGAALIHTVTLTSNLPEGWKFYEALEANGALAAGGNGDILKKVAGGEKLYGMIVDFMPIREKAKGAPVEFVFPKEGVSAVTEPVAILKSTGNPEAAKALVDFLLSKDGQELAAKQGYVPAHPDVALPAGYPPRGDIKIMAFDAGKALAEEASNKKRFEDIFTR